MRFKSERRVSQGISQKEGRTIMIMKNYLSLSKRVVPNKTQPRMTAVSNPNQTFLLFKFWKRLPRLLRRSFTSSLWVTVSAIISSIQDSHSQSENTYIHEKRIWTKICLNMLPLDFLREKSYKGTKNLFERQERQKFLVESSSPLLDLFMTDSE